MPPRAGLLVKRGGETLFIPASVARQLVPLPRLSPMPWDTAQMALVGGEVVAVVELGEPSGLLILCEFSGQLLALSGLSAERVGFWPKSGAGIRVGEAQVPELDLAAAVAQFQARPTEQKDSSA
jgi:hypothetical protein